MTGVVFQVRERSRGNVTASMMLWAALMAVIFFFQETHWWTPRHDLVVVRSYRDRALRVRTGMASPCGRGLGGPVRELDVRLVRTLGRCDGSLRILRRDYFAGLFLITIGWIVIDFSEFVGLGVVAMLVRILRGG